MNKLENYKSLELNNLKNNKPFFNTIKVGTIYVVNYRSLGTRVRVKSFTGICIHKSSKGMDSYITLRNFIGLFCVEFSFYYYSNRVVSLVKVGNSSKKFKKSKLCYLRYKPLSFSTFI